MRLLQSEKSITDEKVCVRYGLLCTTHDGWCLLSMNNNAHLFTVTVAVRMLFIIKGECARARLTRNTRQVWSYGQAEGVER